MSAPANSAARPLAMKTIVMGGGVVGLCTAYFLLVRGHEVVVVERQGDVGRGASRANGCQLSYSYVAPLASPSIFAELPSWLLSRRAPVRLRPQLDPHQWRWSLAFLRSCSWAQSHHTTQRLLALSFYSQQLIREVARNESLCFDYRQNGKLVVYSTLESWKRAIRQLELQRTLGCEQEVLDAAGCCEAEPALGHIRDRIAGGIITRSEETGDCYRFCQELKRVMIKNPRFCLLAATRVERIRCLGDRVIGLETSEGVIDADAYVLAAGVESRRLARPIGIDLPIYPLRGYSVTIPLSSLDDAPTLSVTDYRDKIVYVRIGDALRVAGFAELGGDARDLAEGRIAALIEAVRTTFPSVTNFSRVQPWCGLRPATPQGTPIIGPTPYANLALNVGHGALGFTLAMGAGRVVADILSGREPQISLSGMLLNDGAHRPADHAEP